MEFYNAEDFFYHVEKYHPKAWENGLRARPDDKK